MLWPRDSAQFIAERAKDVEIDIEAVDKMAKLIADKVLSGEFSPEQFLQNELLPLDRGLTEDELLDWVFFITAINFNFWTPEGQPLYTVSHCKTKMPCTGYLAMVNAVVRAIDEGKKMYDPAYYSKLTSDDLAHIFRSDNEASIPLLSERVRVLGEVGTILVEKYDGKFMNVLKKANHSAMKLVEIVTEEFECFRDTAVYEGQKVALFKRAQILVSDIWVLFKGKGHGEFLDMEKLTMFADYRVPQSLVHFGALKYSPTLKEKLDKQHLFQNGDREEVEIRGCAIHAVELAARKAREYLASSKGKGCDINSVMIDFFLWDFRYQNAEKLKSIPFHRVRCIYY